MSSATVGLWASKVSFVEEDDLGEYGGPTGAAIASSGSHSVLRAHSRLLSAGHPPSSILAMFPDSPLLASAGPKRRRQTKPKRRIHEERKDGSRTADHVRAVSPMVSTASPLNSEGESSEAGATSVHGAGDVVRLPSVLSPAEKSGSNNKAKAANVSFQPAGEASPSKLPSILKRQASLPASAVPKPSTGVTPFRPPIAYISGPILPVHDNTSLRRMKFQASRMVKQMNATMVNTARMIQAWYRGERVRKRLKELGRYQAQIARMYRGHVVRRNLARLHSTVIPIQARVRGMLARKIIRHWGESVLLAQARSLLYVKRQMRKRFVAAQTIQARIRGVLARKHYSSKYQNDHAAASKLTLWYQTRFKAYKARELIADLRFFRDKARQIQRCMRNFMWRNRVKAAKLIQRNARAYFVRRLISELYIQITENENLRNEEEYTRMATAEAEAEEDMSLYLVEDYQGRRDVDKKAKELRRDARERRRIFQQQAAVKVQGGLPTNHPAFEFVRYLFKLYDVDYSGYLDEDELRVLLRHMAIPAGEEEFVRAVEWADKDSSGHLNVDEFIVLFTFLESGAFPAGHEPPADWWEGIETTWFNPDASNIRDTGDEASSPVVGTASGSPAVRQQTRTFADSAKRTVTKLGMQGTNLVSYLLTQNSTHHILARRVLTRQARLAAAEQERLQFRFQTPPRVVCPACDTVFVFYAQLEQHLDWSHRTCPVKHNKVLSLRVRYGLNAAFFDRRKEAPVKELVPEEFRMFSEHRVRIERDVPDGPRRQGRTAAPAPLIPSLNGLKEFFSSKKEKGEEEEVDDEDEDGEDEDGDEESDN